jgi:hypothetical protein
MELTPYDELPVHQSPYPFSYVPETDYSWDDGYWFGVFSPEHGIYVSIGLRVNPNTDMVGAYAMYNDRGQQTTARFSRAWRRDFALRIGPFSLEVLKPLKELRLTLEPNDSGLSFDLIWRGVCPAYLEPHHFAIHRGRRTTDQSRYSQPGVAEGVLEFRGRHFDVRPGEWSAARDHSWGLYVERPPLGPDSSLLPPPQQEGPSRAMRLWVQFRTERYSGFLVHHETAEGLPVASGDVFSGLFNGRVYEGWDGTAAVMDALERHFEYRPGTRVLDLVELKVTDTDGKLWRLHFEIAALPWVPYTLGYTLGSWNDGGTFHTYHGSEELVLEWDELDATVQPFPYRPHQVDTEKAKDHMGLGMDPAEPINGIEYMARFRLTDPDGVEHHGAAHVEHMVRGRYEPYGFE